jgi:hypothetical protein
MDAVMEQQSFKRGQHLARVMALGAAMAAMAMTCGAVQAAFDKPEWVKHKGNSWQESAVNNGGPGGDGAKDVPAIAGVWDRDLGISGTMDRLLGTTDIQPLGFGGAVIKREDYEASYGDGHFSATNRLGRAALCRVKAKVGTYLYGYVYGR